MERETIFDSESESKNPGSIFSNIVSGIRESRYIAYRLFLKEIKTQYVDSLLGQFWNFANPIVMALVFIVLFGNGIIETENMVMSYSVYVVYGMFLFQVFTQSIIMPLGIFSRSGDLLRQVTIKPEALILAQLYHLAFNAIFFILVLASVSIAFGEYSIRGFGMFLVLFPSMILTGFGLGLILAPLNAIYSDFSQFVGNAIRPLMFICPTFFRSSNENELLVTINSVNPIAIAMDNLRNLAVNGEWISSSHFIISLMVTIFLFVVGLVFFHLSTRVLSERI